jgi:hypothetical protein
VKFTLEARDIIGLLSLAIGALIAWQNKDIKLALSQVDTKLKALELKLTTKIHRVETKAVAAGYVNGRAVLDPEDDE